MRVELDGVSKWAAEQNVHRLACDLPGQIPERDVDPTDRRNVRHVRMHERHHVREVEFDGKRILTDENLFELFDAAARHRSRSSGLSVAD